MAWLAPSRTYEHFCFVCTGWRQNVLFSVLHHTFFNNFSLFIQHALDFSSTHIINSKLKIRNDVTVWVIDHVGGQDNWILAKFFLKVYLLSR